MSSVLVYYATGEGQTARVADRIAETIAARGHDVATVRAGGESDPPSPGEFDAVLVGASIHLGSHQSEVVEFVRDHRAALEGRPTALFQVSLSSATDAGEAQAAGYVEEFIEATGWHPDRIGLFGGALRYGEYGFLKRLMMKQIAKRQLPGKDVSHDREFTDWEEVEAFADDVAAFVEGRLGIVPPAAASGTGDEPGDGG